MDESNQQSVPTGSEAAPQDMDRDTSTLGSSSDELQKATQRKSSSEVLSDESVAEENNLSTNGIGNELVKIQSEIESSSFTCEAKGDLEPSQSNENTILSEDKTLNDILCDNLNTGTSSVKVQFEDSANQFSSGYVERDKEISAESKFSVRDSQNVTESNNKSLNGEAVSSLGEKNSDSGFSLTEKYAEEQFSSSEKIANETNLSEKIVEESLSEKVVGGEHSLFENVTEDKNCSPEKTAEEARLKEKILEENITSENSSGGEYSSSEKNAENLVQQTEKTLPVQDVPVCQINEENSEPTNTTDLKTNYESRESYEMEACVNEQVQRTENKYENENIEPKTADKSLENDEKEERMDECSEDNMKKKDVENNETKPECAVSCSSPLSAIQDLESQLSVKQSVEEKNSESENQSLNVEKSDTSVVESKEVENKMERNDDNNDYVEECSNDQISLDESIVPVEKESSSRSENDESEAMDTDATHTKEVSDTKAVNDNQCMDAEASDENQVMDAEATDENQVMDAEATDFNQVMDSESTDVNQVMEAEATDFNQVMDSEATDINSSGEMESMNYNQDTSAGNVDINPLQDTSESEIQKNEKLDDVVTKAKADSKIEDKDEEMDIDRIVDSVENTQESNLCKETFSESDDTEKESSHSISDAKDVSVSETDERDASMSKSDEKDALELETTEKDDSILKPDEKDALELENIDKDVSKPDETDTLEFESVEKDDSTSKHDENDASVSETEENDTLTSKPDEKDSVTELSPEVKHTSDSENKEEIIKSDVIEQETITGDTHQIENETQSKEEKPKEDSLLPDKATLRIKVAEIKESKKMSEKTGKGGIKGLRVATPELEKPKNKLRCKKADSSDSSKSRPKRNAAKAAGNKIKSLVQNDLAYEELGSTGVVEEETQENADASKKMCGQCKEVKTCKLLMVQRDGTQYFCSEQCSGAFVKGTQEMGEIDSVTGEFIRKCAQCHSQVTIDDKCLFWETMDFCNEDCLGKYQTALGSNCANCKGSVASSSLGKYCVRFGYDVKQFCSANCLEEYKKGLKVCSYCQKDISTGAEGFLAPVGDKGQFKDFCTQSCMEKYERMNNNAPPPDVAAECAVCSNSKPVRVEVELDNKTHKLCSEPCFAAFKFVNNIKEGQCDMCRKYFDRVKTGNFLLFYDETPRSFCCKTCMNVYILANRKVVPCNWCKVKKYNFDMIKKVSASGKLTMMCSLNCLMLYQVSVNAVCSRRIKCDFCQSVEQAQYHLTMSDATIRNFCTYNCVMSFQNRYPKQAIDIIPGTEQLNSPIPTGVPKRVIPRRSQAESPLVISSVQSLASPNGPASPSGRVPKSRSEVNIVPQVTPITQPITIPTSVSPMPAPPPQIYQQIITKPPPAKQMKNKSILCKPYSHTKGVSCRPHPCMKETQTDESLNRKCLIPVPVPIYVPTPMHMFATPFPVPVPFPLPVPVPIFIPTTRNSAKGIFKEIKRIQEKIPTDPFEAELLMMAEMVAGEKKQDPTDSESEDGNEGDDGGDGTFSPENVDTSNTFGDDMLQMALKMASELEEPAVDMESVLTSNTITTSTQPAVDPNKALYASDPDDPDQVHVMSMNRGRKRSVRGSRNSTGGTPSKRGRRTSGSVDVPLLPPPEPVPPPRIEVEKPDANMCLKYTFGVNAWRHWVMQKNAELEKVAMTNRKIKLFKPELLQLTADELNFSLCLFVKEVRKPNGTEYAPDTIYYLCLGIQQYLFENGRIDNIFTDSYYEKFTDCLDEVAKKFAALYNDSQYIVTRVEEEHLWESKQLGAHSPHVLLSTLMFFNTKHFNLVTVEEHMQLSFSHIMKHWKRNPNTPGVAKIPGSRNVLLRFYPPQSALEANSRKKKVYEQQENEENPLRCPVKLYEFYLSKCPESVKTRNDVFYLLPERSCVPDSPVWYSTMALGKEPLMKMLHRVKMVKEINIALLTC